MSQIPVPEHNWLDQLQEHVTIILAVGAISVGAFKLWWHDRKQTKMQLIALKDVPEHIDELKQDIKSMSKSNQEQHDAIMGHIMDLHK